MAMCLSRQARRSPNRAHGFRVRSADIVIYADIYIYVYIYKYIYVSAAAAAAAAAALLRCSGIDHESSEASAPKKSKNV